MSRRVFVPDLIRKRERNEKIVMLTAYDYSLARLIDEVGVVDVILVGDSLGTVVQGHENTLPVTLEEMIYHCRLVTRAVKRALVIGDMPFMSYQLGPKEALQAAGRLLKEAGVAGVKLEGGVAIADTIQTLVAADIPVMGHVGLTPQSYHRMGGHRIQGRRKDSGPGSESQVLADAEAVADAGAFAIVLEGIPAELGARITNKVEIPTIGIGAGPHCTGQVLVTHDLLGCVPAGAKLPKFVRAYADLQQTIDQAVRAFSTDVKEGVFPGPEHCYASEAEVATVKEFPAKVRAKC